MQNHTRRRIRAIIGLLYLAKQPEAPAPSWSKRSATPRKVPGSFCHKIFQIIRQGRLVVSHRGAGAAGSALSRSPAEINLLHDPQLRDASRIRKKCVTERSGTRRVDDKADRCVLCGVFAEAQRRVNEGPSPAKTLADLINRAGGAGGGLTVSLKHGGKVHHAPTESRFAKAGAGGSSRLRRDIVSFGIVKSITHRREMKILLSPSSRHARCEHTGAGSNAEVTGALNNRQNQDRDDRPAAGRSPVRWPLAVQAQARPGDTRE